MKLLISNIILKFLDVLLTFIILKLGGEELNPLVRYLIHTISLIPALSLVFLSTCIFLYFIYKHSSNYVKYLLPVLILHSCIVLWNTACLVKIYLLFSQNFGIL